MHSARPTSLFTQTVPLGIALGLVAGKAIGVFSASWLLIKFAGAQLPAQSNWPQFFGVCALCGVGFTMSLFIGSLAFEGMSEGYAVQVKLGVLGGSVVAAILGVSILMLCRAESEGAANRSAY